MRLPDQDDENKLTAVVLSPVFNAAAHTLRSSLLFAGLLNDYSHDDLHGQFADGYGNSNANPDRV